MSRRTARFTQAELLKATKVAQKRGLAVAIEEGVIRLIPIESLPKAAEPLPERREIVL